MVDFYWTNALKPTRTYARRLVSKHNLHPPVAIRDLLGDIADIEHDSIPGDIDAVVLHREARRPLVVLSNKLPRSRERFTLAHELGHVLLPWQYGTVVCHEEDGAAPLEVDNLLIEREATCFASEVLLPNRWIQPQFSSVPDNVASAIFDLARAAEVSAHAAAFAVAAAVPFDLALHLQELARDEFSWFISSEPCRLPRSANWTDEQIEQLRESGAHVSEASTRYYRIRAIALARAEGDDLLDVPEEDSGDILNEILSTFPEPLRSKVQRVVNGIIGAANTMHGSSDYTHMLQTLQIRFVGRSTLDQFVAHSRFHDFLRAKAFDLSRRTHSRRGAPLKRRK